MQIQKTNNNATFGMITPINITTAPPPAIVRECYGWLSSGRNAIMNLQKSGITLEKGKYFVDIYDGEKLIGNIPRPTRPQIIESFANFIKEIRKEFAEYTDSRIKVYGPKGSKTINEPIITMKLKGPGRKNIDKSKIRM